jgi:hypothetical protein
MPEPLAPVTPAVANTTPATATVPRSTPKFEDLSPKETVHRVTFSPDHVLALLKAIDPSAPEGKLAQAVALNLDDKGGISIKITYRP